MYTDLKICNYAPSLPSPPKGLYIDIHYQHSVKTVGPFPEDRKDLFLEFANLVEAMIKHYPDGKQDWQGYEDVPGYDRWFDSHYENHTDADAGFRRQLAIETEYTPEGNGCIARAIKFETYWHNGVTPYKNVVRLS